MDGGHHQRQPRPLDELTALRADAKIAAEHRLGRSRPEQHEDPWLDERNLGVEPRPAGTDLRGVRFLMQASLSRGFPFEMLDRIGDIDAGAVDACGNKRLVKQAAGRTNEMLAFDIHAVPWLIA